MTATTTDSTGIARLGTVVLDCTDTLALAEFYSKITGWPVADDSDKDWAGLDATAGVGLSFQRADEYTPPQWPGIDPPQQFHLDFQVADLDDGEAQALAIGAVKHEHQPGESFRVFLDPAGHPFCLCQDG